MNRILKYFLFSLFALLSGTGTLPAINSLDFSGDQFSDAITTYAAQPHAELHSFPLHQGGGMFGFQGMENEEEELSSHRRQMKRCQLFSQVLFFTPLKAENVHRDFSSYSSIETIATNPRYLLLEVFRL